MSFFGHIIRPKDENYRYRTTVFFICLALSALTWLLIKLTGEYSTTIEYPLTITEIPKGKLLTNQIDSTLTVGIRDKGFRLMGLKYFSPRRKMEIKIGDLKLQPRDQGFLATTGTQTWVHQNLDKYDAGNILEFIRPDTLIFMLENEISREVPVIPEINFRYKKQFFAYDSLKVSPAYVRISGSRSQIEKVHFIKTSPASFSNLSSDVSAMVGLEKPAKGANINIEPAEVNILLHVEKFTEAEITIPVTKINPPEDVRIKLFPETVNVLYLVALRDFNKINADMFRCNVNLTNIDSDEDKKLNVHLDAFPQFVRINRIEPSEVEFLMLK